MKFVLFLVVMASAFLCTRARNILSAALEEEESNDAALTRVKDRMMDAEVLLEKKKEMSRAEKEMVFIVKNIADEHKKSAAQVLLRWGYQMGMQLIPRTKNWKRLEENVAIFDFELTTHSPSCSSGSSSPASAPPPPLHHTPSPGPAPHPTTA